MNEMHIKEFLNQLPIDELVRREVLRGSTRLLNKGSVYPLLDLMADHDITRLDASERDWFLTSHGEFRNPRSTEIKSGKIGELSNLGNVFNEQNVSINPHYKQRNESPELAPDEDAKGGRFGLERDLQKALRENVEQLESGLKIVDDGVERGVEGGRIDITAEDAEGTLTVIELKAGVAKPASIAQLLSYMDKISGEAGGRPVRGILIANDFHHQLISAARAVPNVTLISYSFQFVFGERR